jgi:hypothetical protein
VVAKLSLMATSPSIYISTITRGIDISGVGGCLYTIRKRDIIAMTGASTGASSAGCSPSASMKVSSFIKFFSKIYSQSEFLNRIRLPGQSRLFSRSHLFCSGFNCHITRGALNGVSNHGRFSSIGSSLRNYIH